MAITKILTNYHSEKFGGIAQTLSSFVDFIQTNEKSRLQIIGIEFSNSLPDNRTVDGAFTLVQKKIEYPHIKDVIKNSTSIEQVRQAYSNMIENFETAIKEEAPDLILINGTFFVPWCLMTAARKFKLPIIVHYHGSLTKETEHWDPKSHGLFKQMEKEFDSGRTYYIFPSKLARQVVEDEVFGHPIKNVAILPNSVSLHFFENTPKGKRQRIGIVSRKSKVKNPEFILRLARYNAKQKDNFEINIITDLKESDKLRKQLTGLVNFVAPVKNNKLPQFYSRMGVILSPSFFETYGNVPKEAIASGVPALINSKMGVAETFEELGLNDWIVDFRSVRNVYKKIKEISGTCVDEGIRKKIKNAYSPIRIHKKLIKIIHSI